MASDLLAAAKAVLALLARGHVRDPSVDALRAAVEEAERASPETGVDALGRPVPKVVCAPCSSGRHSNRGPPEYGRSDCCPDMRCSCECRRVRPKGDES